jgi:hypothetical protein
LLCGSSFIAVALGIFANRIVSNKDNWYENELKNRAYEIAFERSSSLMTKLKLWLLYNFTELKGIVIFVLFITCSVIIALICHEEWEFVEALYFSISSLSTGGLYSQPPGTPAWQYLMTGFYSAFGVPVMALAMATFSSFFIKTGTMEGTLKRIKQPVSEHELKMLSDFGMHVCMFLCMYACMHACMHVSMHGCMDV